MKSIMMAAMVILAPGASAGPEPEVFEVSKMTKAQRPLLLKLFEAVQESSDEPKRFEALSKVAEGQYLAYAVVAKFAPANPYVRMGGRGGVVKTGEKADRSQLYLVRFNEEPKGGVADREKFELRCRLLSQTEAVGARTVRVYHELPDAEPITREAFLKRLKGGETFDVSIGEKCRRCNGFKRVTPPAGVKGARDGKVACPGCRGSGQATRGYRIQW